MSSPNQPTNSALARWLRPALLVGVLWAASPHGVCADSPEEPFLTVHRARFTESFYDGTTFLVGVIQEVEYTGKRSAVVPTPRTKYEVNLQVQVIRHYCGIASDLEEISIRSLWYRPIDFQFDGAEGELKPGQRIFYHARKGSQSPKSDIWDSGEIGPATDNELERYDRIFQVLATEEPDLAVVRLREGCFSRDGYYGAWCLNALAESQEVADHAIPDLYKRIRGAITRAEVRDLCWRVLLDEQLPSIAFTYADMRLMSLQLSDEEIATRHRRFLERFSQLHADRDLKGTDREIKGELNHLIRVAYPKMPVAMRIEAIAKLAQVVDPEGPERFRTSVHYYVPSLWKDAREVEMRQAMFAFYRDLAPPPLAQRFPFFRGLRTVMQTETNESHKLSREGLAILEVMLLASDPRTAQAAAFELTYYGRQCHQRKLDWEALLERIVELRDATPYAAARARLTESLKTWGVEEKRLDKS